MRGFKRFLRIVFFGLLCGCSRLPTPEEPATVPIIPVFEVFGYARCSNCPAVEHALDSIKFEFDDSVVVLQYHMRILGDTLSPQSILERQNLYNVGSSAPVTVIHGEEILQGSSGVSTQLFKAYYSSIRSREDSVAVVIASHLEGDSVLFTLSVKEETVVPGARLFIFVTQDSIIFKQTGVPDTIFNNVVRFYSSLLAEFPCQVRVSRTLFPQGNFVALLQDTLSKKIISVTQRRF